MSKEAILKQFRLFSLGGEGIGGWLTAQTDDRVFARLDEVQDHELTREQFNQILGFGHQAPVSVDFFHYYWLDSPLKHPYPVDQLPGFEQQFLKSAAVTSLSHLKWGLYRLFTDALLYFGNVRTAFRVLRTFTREDLDLFFQSKRFDTDAIKRRGEVLPLRSIPQDDRYLISEMACKSFGEGPDSESELYKMLCQRYQKHCDANGGDITFRGLLNSEKPTEEHSARQGEFEFAMSEALDESVSSEEEFNAKFGRIFKKFSEARKCALSNTQHYLSIANDLDVYVATSMRTRENFREMARFCDEVFQDQQLANLHLRHFDPTLSAAHGHEDKGLIECLMVKCAKALVYCAGDVDSYGKDAEAAMALSLGKPVIFHCDQEQRTRFYREIHPLSRLIEFSTGVAVGAMVTDDIEQVKTLLSRLFENKMHYQIEEHPSRKGYLLLKERLTDSVVRLQTNDRMLTEAFWNHYHNPFDSGMLR